MPEPSAANPFPGLRPYQDYEASLFFGRKSPAAQIIEKLGDQRFIAVVGTSGSGKSSIVNCGVLPTLSAGFYLPRGSRWRVVRTEPGGEPIRRLAQQVTAALADRLGGESGNGHGAADHQAGGHIEALSEAILRHGDDGLVNLVRQARLPSSDNVLIVVDQFEELFRYKDQHPGPNEARHFVDLLLRAAEDQGEHIYVMLTMRSDFLGDCMLLPGLPEAINDGLFLVPAMNRDEREKAVRGPIKVAGAEIEVPLVNRILDDIGDELDQLPLLQHALMRTWQEWEEDAREAKEITLRHYLATVHNGTTAEPDTATEPETTVIERALDDHAQDVWKSLTPRQRQIARKIFQAITDVDDRGRPGRKPRRLGPVPGEKDEDRKDLSYVTSLPVEELIPVIDVFRATDRSFLKPEPRQELGAGTVIGEDLHAGSVIDVWHESLIRNWATLHGWMDEEAKDKEIYTDLAKEAARERPSLTRAKLQTAIEWAERRLTDATTDGKAGGSLGSFRRRALGLSTSEVATIQPWASKHATDVKDIGSFAQMVEVFRKKVRQWAGIRYGARLLTVAVVAGLIVLVAWQRNATHDQQRAAYAKLAGSLADPLHSALVVSELRQEPPNDLFLFDVFNSAKPPGIDRVGRLIEATGVPVAAILNDSILGPVSLVGFNAGGDSVVIASTPGSFNHIVTWPADGGGAPNKLWVSENGEYPVHAIVAESGAVVGLFSDGRLGVRAPGTDDWQWTGTLDRLDEAERVSLGAKDQIGVASAVSRDGSLVAIVYHSGQMAVWPTGADGEVRILSGAGVDSSTSLVTFSDDGLLLATLANNTATVWDLDGQTFAQCLGHGDDIERAAFDSEARRLVTAAADRTGRVWVIERTGQMITCTPEHVLAPHLGNVNHAKFSLDGGNVVTVSDDGLARVWNLGAADGQPRILRGHENSVANVWFGPDSTTVLTAGTDGLVLAWNMANGRRIRSLYAGTDTARVAFDSEGHRVVTAASGGGVRVWRMEPRAYDDPPRLEGHEAGIISMDYSRSDTIAMTQATDRSVIVWNLNEQHAIGSPVVLDSVGIVALAPNDRWAAAATGTTVKVWSLSPGSTTADVGQDAFTTTAPAPVTAMVFSPDSQLITGDRAGVVRVWSISDSIRQVNEILPPRERGWRVTAMAADPTSSRVLIGYNRREAHVWSLESDTMIRLWIKPHPSEIRATAYGPAGRRFASAVEGKVFVWQVGESQPVASLDYGATGLVHGLRFSPDGDRLVAYGDNGLHVWDIRNGAELERVLPDSGVVSGAALGRDGNLRMWTSSVDDDATLWPVPWKNMVEWLGTETGAACLTRVQRIAFFDESESDAELMTTARCDEALARLAASERVK